MYDYIDPRTLLLTSEDLKKSQELCCRRVAFSTDRVTPSGAPAEVQGHREEASRLPEP